MNQNEITELMMKVRDGEMSPLEAARLVAVANKARSAFFHISDQLDKLNASVKGASMLTFFIDYAKGLMIQLTVQQPAVEKKHNFVVIISPEMMKGETRSDEELIKSLFAPIFEALGSIQVVPTLCPVLLDSKGDVLIANS
jgi:hypothetical protein